MLIFVCIQLEISFKTMNRAIFFIVFALVMMTAHCDIGGCDKGNNTVFSNVISDGTVKKNFKAFYLTMISEYYRSEF